MKRILYSWLTAIATTIAVSSFAVAQSQGSSSLGDYARAVKKTPKAEKASPKIYDNDNLPTGSSVSVVGQAPEQAANQPGGSQAKDGEKSGDGKVAGDKSEADTKAENAAKPGQTPEDRQKMFTTWKAKLDEQKKQIGLLSRELDVLQREHDLKASEFYASTAHQLQNANFNSEDLKYKKQIAEKQKDLDAAKVKLSDMREQARKSGAPNSVTE